MDPMDFTERHLETPRFVLPPWWCHAEKNGWIFIRSHQKTRSSKCFVVWISSQEFARFSIFLRSNIIYIYVYIYIICCYFEIQFIFGWRIMISLQIQVGEWYEFSDQMLTILRTWNFNVQSSVKGPGERPIPNLSLTYPALKRESWGM